jgi:hypothetical protein
MGMRPVLAIQADIDNISQKHLAMMRIVEEDHIELRDSQSQWDDANLKLQAAQQMPGGTNPLFRVNLGPRPKLPADALSRANAFHALAYVLADLQQELAAHSLQARRRAYREEHLAGARLDVTAPAPQAEPEGVAPDERRRYREALLKKAGITLAPMEAPR